MVNGYERRSRTLLGTNIQPQMRCKEYIDILLIPVFKF